MNKILYICGLILLVGSPFFTHAGPIIRSGEAVSIDAGQILKGDFYGFSPTLTMSGPAEEDVYVMGGNVTINAPILKDLTVVGGVVQVHGDVGDDVRIVGGEVTLAKSVKGDVAVFGGTLTILSTALIEGDVLFMGGDVVIEGDVVGGVHGTANSARINAEVGGDVLMNVTDTISLGDNARVVGSMFYTSATELVRSQNADISGEIRQTEPTLETGINFLKFYTLVAIAVLFTAVALFFGMRKNIERTVELSVKESGVSGLIGLGVFLITPFLSMIFSVSIIGVPLGICLFFFYMALLFFAFIMSGAFVGVYVQKLMTKKQTLSLSTVMYGTVLLAALALIPVIGGLVAFGCLMITFGALNTLLYQRLRA